MIDFVGISSHHDTITGTSRTKPVEDTFRRMKKAQDINVPVYSEIINKVIGLEDFAGTQHQWNHSTSQLMEDLDQLFFASESELIFLVHNPSHQPIQEVILSGAGYEFKRYKNNIVDYRLSVQEWDPVNKVFSEVYWVKQCLNETTQRSLTNFKTHCDILVRHEVPPRSGTAIKIKPIFFNEKHSKNINEKTNLWTFDSENPQPFLNYTMTSESGHNLTLWRIHDNSSIVDMQLCNSSSHCRNLSFGMRMWETIQGAGVYIDRTSGVPQNFSYLQSLNEYNIGDIHILELEFKYHNFTKNETNKTETTNTTEQAPNP